MMLGSSSRSKYQSLCSDTDGPVGFDSPDRWDNLPEAASIIPGLFPSLLTFSAGPRVRHHPHFAPVSCADDTDVHFI